MTKIGVIILVLIGNSIKLCFGVEAKVGLASSSLPDELISKVDTGGHLFDLASMEVNTNTDVDSSHSTDDEAMDTSEVLIDVLPLFD